MNRKKNRQILIMLGIVLSIFIGVNQSGMAAEEEQLSSDANIQVSTVEEQLSSDASTQVSTVEDRISRVAVPEVSTVDEPQRALGELLNLEQSRIASTGINSRAPFYATFQLKEEFLNWTITALNYQSVQQPSEYFLVDVNKKQEGSYVGERVTEDTMTEGSWKLSEVWVVSPRNIVLCIPRSPEDEAAFVKFDFQLIKSQIVESGTEQGSLVERPVLENGMSSVPKEPVGAIPEPVIEQPSVHNESIPEQQAANTQGETSNAAVPLTQSGSSESIVPSEASPTISDSSLEQGSTEEIAQGSSTIEELALLKKEERNAGQESLPTYIWIIGAVLLLVVGAGTLFVYVSKRK